jgi:hypothetical protein
MKTPWNQTKSPGLPSTELTRIHINVNWRLNRGADCRGPHLEGASVARSWLLRRTTSTIQSSKTIRACRVGHTA